MEDQFQLVTQLGQSGWCTVYLAEQKSPNRPVILKLLNGHVVSDPQKSQHFTSEAEALKHLSHPHIASLLDYGINSYGQPYLAFEHVRGTPLNEYQQQQGLLPVATSLEIARQVCEALTVAHEAGIVHRDLRPQNIVLANSEGEDINVKIFDFSFAKLLSLDGLSFEEMTATGMMIGTPAYMSPEQCTGENLDGRSDIYSLGCVLYEMLCGQTPFQDASGPFQTIQNHLNTQPVSVASLRADRRLPVGLDALVMRMLKKDPAERYQSVAALLPALTKIGKTLRKPSKMRARLKLAILVATLFSIGWWLRDYETGGNKQTAAPAPANVQTGSEDHTGDAAAPQGASSTQEQQEAQRYCDQAAISFRAGQFADAAQDYSLALQIDPSMMAAYEGRALVYLKMGKAKEAIADCSTYVRQNPGDAAALYCLGRLYRSIGDAPHAAEYLSKSLELSPDPAAYCDRGLLYLHLSKPLLAHNDLVAIDSMTKDSKQSSRSLGSCRALLAGALDVYEGRHRDALPYLTSVLKENPTWKEAYMLRALCYDKLGRPALAAKDREIGKRLTDLSDLVVGG